MQAQRDPWPDQEIVHTCAFITLNPADIADLLLGAMAGVVPDEWKSWDSFKRCKFVAENPGPAAIFFDVVIEGMIF
jgi:hypothetical protein